jgi:PilZ domain.
MSIPLPTEPAAKEKRRYLRLPRPYRVQARELVFPIAKDPLIDTSCTDIGKGGLCVEAKTALPVGTRLHVNVHIPLLNKFASNFLKVYENDADQYFQAIADVAWVKPHDSEHLMGLKFINVDEEMCEALGKIIMKAFQELEKN